MCEAVNTISDVAQGRSAAMNDNGNQIYDGPGELAAALDDFDVITYNLIHTKGIQRKHIKGTHNTTMFFKLLLNANSL